MKKAAAAERSGETGDEQEEGKGEQKAKVLAEKRAVRSLVLQGVKQ